MIGCLVLGGNRGEEKEEREGGEREGRLQGTLDADSPDDDILHGEVPICALAQLTGPGKLL